MWCLGAKQLDFEDIKRYTDNFSKENFITKSQHGSVYRGRNGSQEFTVKLWDDDMGWMLMDEFGIFEKFTKLKGHPKRIYYCNDDNHPRAILYDLKTMDSLNNLIPKDSFLWLDRIKVALVAASAIASYNAFTLRNVDAAHILCDEDYNPKLYEFGMLLGETQYDGQEGSPGYIDPFVLSEGYCTIKTDVYAYGVVLLGLITKRVYNAKTDREDYVVEWAREQYVKMQNQGETDPILVHGSLRGPCCFKRDSQKITKLAMQCIKVDPQERPTMDEVVKQLKSLRVVVKYGKEIRIHEMLAKL